MFTVLILYSDLVSIGSSRDILLSEHLRSDGPSNQMSTQTLYPSVGVPVMREVEHQAVLIHDDFPTRKEYPSIPPDTSASLGSLDNLPHQVILSPEQSKVLQMVQQGKNVFFTGSAGMLFTIAQVNCLHLPTHSLLQAQVNRYYSGRSSKHLGMVHRPH
jgi:hypothetical protein